MQVLNIVALVVLSFLVLTIIYFLGFAVGYHYYKHKVLTSIAKATEHITKEIKTRQTSSQGTGKEVPDFSRIINGVRYKTLDAKCIAQGGVETEGYWTWLMQTNNKSFFFVMQSPVTLGIVPTTRELAMEVFSHAQKQEVTFQAAFPDIEIKDA